MFGSLETGLRVLKWHEDMIEMPPGAALLGETPVTPGTALFRIGTAAWGSQAHLEVDVPMLVDGWLADRRRRHRRERAGYEPDWFRADSRRRLERQTAAARPVFTRFAELVRDQRLWLTASTLLPSGSSTNAA